MLQQEFVVGPSALDGAINVELGHLAVVLRNNQVVHVLGPGRYSRSRLLFMGVVPTQVTLLLVRTALTRFTAECTNVPLDGGNVDLSVVVFARLRLDSDLREFFTRLISTYGTDVGAIAPTILQQLVTESLQESAVNRSTVQSSGRTTRALTSVTIEPHEIFEISEVATITITRDDPISVQSEIEARLRPLERSRRLAEVTLAAEEGELRASACIELASKLGVDPLFLWDPDGHRADVRAQRDAVVRLLGEYGENLAVLAEATNMNSGIVETVLRPILPLQSAEEGAPARNVRWPASSLHKDASIGDIERALGVRFAGGVHRSRKIDNKMVELVLVVGEGEVAGGLRDEVQRLLGTGVLLGVFVRADGAEELAREIAGWVLGVPARQVDISDNRQQLMWRLPSSVLHDMDLAEFAVETVCDLFLAPPLIPVVQ